MEGGDTGCPDSPAALLLSRAGRRQPRQVLGNGWEAVSCPQTPEFRLHSSAQEMGIGFLGLAPGWSETKIEKILSDQEMIPPGN